MIAALTADHGEEFWEHGYFEHGHDYYREITHVPLVFWGPNRLPAGRLVDRLAGLVDVPPTLLELAGLEPAAPGAPDEGRSLAALCRRTAPTTEWTPLPRFSGGNLYNLPAVLVEDGPWRYLLRANGVEELYDVVEDPLERHDLSAQRPEIAARYRQLLEPRLESFLVFSEGEDPREISPEELRALKALGYVR